MDREAALLEASVQQTIADCGGDPVAAVRALIVANTQILADFENLKGEIARLTSAVSPGYMRSKFRRGASGGSGP
ncbi:hypothetical protein [Labrys wisconsinensis]|uniref:Uncharacterized protein n=1 Tax=Labrys wisconsinensis TaxID=425677 RepID=A0ABU0JGY4_9HYPH|nr:hypothetical protein [Labrys wisconsinensis]MDQ0472845.1 hypothetical protein [Labrys wisconsinensis]